MTNQQILTTAIEKAIAGGWDLKNFRRNREIDTEDFDDARMSIYEVFIYNHEFARCIWGEKPSFYSFAYSNEPESIDRFFTQWQFHLMQMVTSPDPIAYLGEHL